MTKPTKSTSGASKLNRAARRKHLQEAYAKAHPETDKAPVTHSVASLKTALRANLTKEQPAEPTTKAKKSTKRAAKQPAKSLAEDSIQEEITASSAESFRNLALPESLHQAIAEVGFEAMTPIQAKAIPLLLEGHDLIGQAQTGTGKTAAFALPIIAAANAADNFPQALVLAPTRELAVQVAGGIYELAKHSGLRVVPVYGGQPIDRQFRALKNGAHIVVGTPGRIIDHLRRGSLSLDKVSFCVLDEADEMLEMGFMEEVEEILATLPAERQMAFFSATIPARVKSLAKRFLQSPRHVEIAAKHRTVEAISQTYYEVPHSKKLDALALVLDMEAPGPTIIFCRTRQETGEVAEALRLRGYNAEALNGEMSQNDRDRVLRRFRSGAADLLVATDVAARGLDIETVTHVINYAVPFDVEQYIHRIGRTGRAGRSGDAITLVEIKDRRKLKSIEQATGVKMKKTRIPTAADITARRRSDFREEVRKALEKDDYDAELEMVNAFNDDYDTSQIAAAALHLLWQSRHQPLNPDDDIAVFSQPETGMTRLFVGLGKQDNLRPGELVAIIAGKCGVSGKEIGSIDILQRSAFVEVPSEITSKAISVLRKERFRGKKAKVDIATPKRF